MENKDNDIIESKPTEIIKHLQKMLLEKDDIKLGKLFLSLKGKLQNMLFVSDDISVQAMWTTLIRLGAKEYLENNRSEDSTDNMNKLINRLDDCLIYIRN
ncbi:hypothetical protein N9Q68_01440 [Polaribacter sp.]|nr:hypothetical protein [Polaribacter sp.]